jgi:hypothetical protein
MCVCACDGWVAHPPGLQLHETIPRARPPVSLREPHDIKSTEPSPPCLTARRGLTRYSSRLEMGTPATSSGASASPSEAARSLNASWASPQAGFLGGGRGCRTV